MTPRRTRPTCECLRHGLRLPTALGHRLRECLRCCGGVDLRGCAGQCARGGPDLGPRARGVGAAAPSVATVHARSRLLPPPAPPPRQCCCRPRWPASAVGGGFSAHALPGHKSKNATSCCRRLPALAAHEPQRLQTRGRLHHRSRRRWRWRWRWPAAVHACLRGAGQGSTASGTAPGTGRRAVEGLLATACARTQRGLRGLQGEAASAQGEQQQRQGGGEAHCGRPVRFSALGVRRMAIQAKARQSTPSALA